MNVYCQGKIVPETECFVPSDDHGFLYGISLFETFRTFGGKPFQLESHLQRLRSGCRSFSIAWHQQLLGADSSGKSLRLILQNLLDANDCADAVFRYTISAGTPNGNGADFFYKNPREFLFVRPLPPPAPADGIVLHLLKTSRKPPEFFPRPKSGNFADSLLAFQELRKRKSAVSDEGVLLTADGRLSECVHSNLFLVRGDTLFTPAPSAHLLEGITRRMVLKLAEDLKIESREIDLHLGDLENADAIFTTNSVRGLTPVSKMNDEKGARFWQKNSARNPIVRNLIESYSKLTIGD